MSLPSVEIAIDRLTVHGLSPAAQRRCSDAFAAELQRLLAAEPMPDLAADRLPPLKLDLATRPATAAGLGIAAARAFHAALAARE